MTRFPLPPAQANDAPAVFDADSAARWLAGQPQANADAMLVGLLAQIEAFNACAVAPGERFATLEVLRKSVFAVSDAGRRRFACRALPLLPGEQSVLDGVRRLWRCCALTYLHCLHACLEQDASIVPRRAEVAHRVLSCLRLEQMSGYVAAAEPAADFWSLVHAAWAGAEQLDCTRQTVSDRLLGETQESTVSGQYCMALLLHLARPFSLSREQFAAAVHWFARWRELAEVLTVPPAEPKAYLCAIDLASAQAVHDPRERARAGRWLSLRGVLRKLRQRLEALGQGLSPESLKLGSALSASQCKALLKTLDYRLTHAQSANGLLGDGESVVLAVGFENIYRHLGGALPGDSLTAAASSSANKLAVEQIAVFGHVVREPAQGGVHVAEIWRLAGHSPGQLELTRAPGAGPSRLVLGGLLAIRLPRRGDDLLVTVSGLCARRDGLLCVEARPLPGRPTPLLAEARDMRSGAVSRHAAILLAAEGDSGASQIVIAAGLAQRAQALGFCDEQGGALPDLRVDACLARCGDAERWSVALGEGRYDPARSG